MHQLYEQDQSFIQNILKIYADAEKEVKISIQKTMDGLKKREDDLEEREDVLEKREKDLLELEKRIKNLIIENDKRVKKIEELRKFQENYK